MKKRVIICVDDEKNVLTALKKQLKLAFIEDFTVEIAESGDEGFEVFEELIKKGIDVPVVISDHIMPGMNGDELLTKIFKKKPETHNILLTGLANIEAVGNAVNEANLYRYITKPWNSGDFILTVKGAIESYDQKLQIEKQNIKLAELNESLELKVVERTKQLRESNEELHQSLELVHTQKTEIERQNKNITDSINYASRIQQAVLPPDNFLSKIMPENFILFKPRDVVSGDFYWFKKIGDFVIITVADCTGHGVPGAFMSMLGIAFLNEIIRRKQIVKSSQVLNLLRDQVKAALNQDGKDGEQKDGIDIAFCIINTKTNVLQFAGANNPLYVIRKSKDIKEFQHLEHTKLLEHNEYVLIQIIADRQPISIYRNEKPFTNYEFPLYKDDKLYLVSDGFQDQLGGKNGKKFKTRNFKKLLLQIHAKSMQDQKNILEQKFGNWKGSENEQTDDILMIGIKI